MALTESNMLPVGTKAPNFYLPHVDGAMIGLDDFKDKEGLLVIFMCNHCPYVIHVAEEVKNLTDEYMERGIGVVGINSNDVKNYPDDSPEKMKEEVNKRGYHFPYLFDGTQQVARSYDAACTPDFYLFDKNLKLVYRGRLDETRPGGAKPHGGDLRKALDQMLAGEAVSVKQLPSMGCNIKWKS